MAVKVRVPTPLQKITEPQNGVHDMSDTYAVARIARS